MLNFDFIDSDYPDFIHRLDEFLNLIPYDQKKCSKNDLLFLYSVIYSKKPQYILEIGRSYGTSTITINGAISDNNYGHLYSIDIENLLSKDISQLIAPRTTLITESSVNLLTALDKKFEVTFIDGDHSFNMVVNDLNKSIELSTNEAIVLCHDSDSLEVSSAINEVCNTNSQVTNCGVFGDKIQMLIVRK